MPDYVRIGPPYGQVNELMRPYVYSSADASADVARFGVRGFWTPDNWAPIASTIHPASAQASWAISAQLNTVALDASNIAPLTQGWTITAATAMPPSSIVARATVTLPYAATGMFVFELIGAATFAAFPVVPEILANANTLGFLQATANGSVIGSIVTPAGSGYVWDYSRFYAHQPLASSTALQSETLTQQQQRYVTIQIRAVGSVASGATLRIQHARLANLPVAWASAGGAPASAAIAFASALVGTYYTLVDRGLPVNRMSFSKLTRYPALPTIDAQQPAGQAMEIGSTMVAGQVDWGSDLVQKNYSQSLLTPGDPFTYDRIPNRSLKFPYLQSNPSSAQLYARDLNRVIVPGNVVDVVLENGYRTTRFDIRGGRAVYQEDVRYSRANLARGVAEIATDPYGRGATAVAAATLNNFGAATSAMPFFVEGDVPAPAVIVVKMSAIGSVAGGYKTYARGFIGVIVPSVATYLPIPANATADIFGASRPNGFHAPGSQIHLPAGFPIAGSQIVVRGVLTPLESEVFAFRNRVFVSMAAATTATCMFQLNFSAGPVSFAASWSSGRGFLLPLDGPGGESSDLSFVDLGEVRTPRAAQSIGTVTWSLLITSASQNSTAAIFDSIILLPIADAGWFGIQATYPITGGGTTMQYVVSPDGVKAWEYTDTPPSVMLNASANQLEIYSTLGGDTDVGQFYQGRAPYLNPGINHGFMAPIGVGGQVNARAYTFASHGCCMTPFYYPRFLFVQ